MKLGIYYIVRRLQFNSEALGNTVLDAGKCVYIHPALRYVLLQFPCGLRECFFLTEIIQEYSNTHRYLGGKVHA